MTDRGKGLQTTLFVVLVCLCVTQAWAAETPGVGRACGNSVSIGTPMNGVLRCGNRLQRWGEHHYLQPFTRDQDYRYGTDELVNGLLWVANSMAEAGIDRIAIGSMSKRGGGDLPLSGSHESGRDVDLPFLMSNPSGAHIESLYHHFNRRGISKTHGNWYRFDVEGNWRLLTSLLACPHFEVQFIVIAPALKKLLLAGAAKRGVSQEAISRIEQILVPPKWAKPHDNHFHVRIACPKKDVGGRCRG